MENDVKEFLSELLKQLKSIDYIKPEDIPVSYTHLTLPTIA